MKRQRKKSLRICPFELLQHLVHIDWLPNTPFVGERCGGGPQGCPHFLPCPSIPHSPMPHVFCQHFATLPALCRPRCSTIPHASCPGFPTLPFLACPRTPLAHVSCPRFRTLAFLACPGAPPMSNLLCLLPVISYPVLACLPPVSHASSLSHRVADAA